MTNSVHAILLHHTIRSSGGGTGLPISGEGGFKQHQSVELDLVHKLKSRKATIDILKQIQFGLLILWFALRTAALVQPLGCFFWALVFGYRIFKLLWLRLSQTCWEGMGPFNPGVFGTDPPPPTS
jgi:hypothetical protein